MAHLIFNLLCWKQFIDMLRSVNNYSPISTTFAYAMCMAVALSDTTCLLCEALSIIDRLFCFKVWLSE